MEGKPGPQASLGRVVLGGAEVSRRPEEAAGHKVKLSGTEATPCGSKSMSAAGTRTPCPCGEMIDLGSLLSDLELGWRTQGAQRRTGMCVLLSSPARVGCLRHRHVTLRRDGDNGGLD